MKQSVAAILARNLGNRKHAIRYCVRMAKNYPALRVEYRGYILALRLGTLLGR